MSRGSKNSNYAFFMLGFSSTKKWMIMDKRVCVWHLYRQLRWHLRNVWSCQRREERMLGDADRYLDFYSQLNDADIHWDRNTALKERRMSFLMAQWYRNHLPMQETWDWSLMQKDATEQLSSRTKTTEPALQCPGATTTEAFMPESLMFHKRSHCNEKSAHHKQRVAPTCHN